MTTANPNWWQRNREGVGVWEHRGKVAVAGVGHSPVDRRWDGKDFTTSLGAYSILAAQRALEDAGVKMEDIDGVMSSPGPLGDPWGPGRPYFDAPYDSEDGISKVTAEWLAKQMGLPNVTYLDSTAPQIGQMFGKAAEVVASGQAKNLLVLYPTGNLEGRYHQDPDTFARGPQKWSNIWGFTGGSTYAYQFEEYCRRYGGSHDDMAALIVNSRRNGLTFDWGYYSLHQPDSFTVEDYLNARWVQKPLNLFDNDRPVNGAACYLFTTADRAKDMKQTPVYIWNHAEHTARQRSIVQTLDEAYDWCESEARKTMEGSGLDISEIDIFNPYDGFTLFTQTWLEAFGWHGVKRGEALPFYNSGIESEGKHPFLTSGGNSGVGRTRTSMFTDSIEQLRGTAGKRQVTVKAETAIAGCVLPQTNGHVVFSKFLP